MTRTNCFAGLFSSCVVLSIAMSAIAQESQIAKTPGKTAVSATQVPGDWRHETRGSQDTRRPGRCRIETGGRIS